MPGARARSGPAQDSGEQRRLNIGSVRMTAPGTRIRKLAWLMNVIAALPGATDAGGGENAAFGT